MSAVSVDRDLCIGSGNCVHFAPGTFELDDEGLAVAREDGGESRETLEAVVRQCPTGAIALAD